MSMGHGPGLSNRPIGQKSGAELTTHVTANLPNHNHLLNTTETTANTPDPNGALFAKFTTGNNSYTNNNPPVNHQMASNTVTHAGANLSVNNMQPFQVVLYCVALEGLFPSRN